MRILLTEGSGLTSRQVATRLGQLGHEVEVLSSTPLCLARFTHHVRRIHEVPRFGSDPLAWFAAAKTIARDRRINLIFPTQEQVTVLSAFAAQVGVPTLVPDFAALRRVQDKLAAWETLREASVPQPEAQVLRNETDLAAVHQFPLFLKQPIGTASAGVRRVTSSEHLYGAAAELGLSQRLLAQQEVRGELVMAQALADRGQLVAFHANVRVREGIGGGAATKRSVHLPALQEDTARLLRHLSWHGPLSLDAILGETGAMVIDINPRLVEPMNAWHAGTDLVGMALELGLGRHPAPQPAGGAGVVTHQLLLSVLAAAQSAQPRGQVLGKLWNAALGLGPWREGVEELTPIAGDWRAGVPTAAAALFTLVRPESWRMFHRGAVGPYALSPQGWAAILAKKDAVA